MDQITLHFLINCLLGRFLNFKSLDHAYEKLVGTERAISINTDLCSNTGDPVKDIDANEPEEPKSEINS